MATTKTRTQLLTVDDLRSAVERMSPAERREFTRWFANWQDQNGSQTGDEAALVQATKARLSVADERRLKRLIDKSEGGTLSPKELQVYRALAQQAQRLSVTRVEALSELVRRKGKPVREVMEEIGWEGCEDYP
jgi:hypothetical protein